MSYYSKIKKLDEESLDQLTEGKGPSDACLCSVLAPPEDKKGRLSAMGASVKKALATIGGAKRKAGRMHGNTSVDIPLTFTRGGKGIYTTKEAVKRKTPCGKCGCDDNKFVLKHSFANIKIISPDISSICPCPENCLPNKAKLQDNIKVTVERLEIHPDKIDSEACLQSDVPKRQTLSEPVLDKLSSTQLMNDQFDDDVYSDWSFDDIDDDDEDKRNLPVLNL